MTASLTPAQIERFKRAAKQLHRATALSHSQALDQIASANGYGNWSLLMKHNDTGERVTAKNTCPHFRFIRTSEQMRIALHKVPEPRGWIAPKRTDVAQQQVEDISQAFASPQNAIQFGIDYVTCLLTVPRFKIYSAAPAYWEMRSWLPYSCERVSDDVYILVNRNYKPVGQVSKDWAKYDESPHLHVRIAGDLRKCFTAPGSTDGYLFNDGCTPWYSREDAEGYLERLHVLRTVLKD